MVDKIVNYILKRQISNGIMKEDESGVYQYGYTLFFEKLINIIIVIIICLFTKKWLEIWSFLLFMIPLRSFAGGWHAKKFWQCTLISNLIIIFMIFIIPYINIRNYVIFLFIEIIFFAIIILTIPVQHSNRPLSEKEKNVYKKNTLIIWFIECVLIFVFAVINYYNFVLIIMYAHLVMILAAIGGLIENKMEQTKCNK